MSEMANDTGSVHDAAAAAIDAAGGLTNLMSEGAGVPQEAVPAAPEAPATPAPSDVAPAATPGVQQVTLYRDPHTGRFTAEPPAADETPAEPEGQPETFWNGDPNSLSPELRQAYDNMQADYTRKTQEIAELRKQYEPLKATLGQVDPAQVQEALLLYNQLSDPTAWQALHTELSNGLQALGLSPAQADAAAAQQMEEAAHVPSADPFADFEDDDGNLAPVKSAFEQLQQQLDAVQAQLAQRNEAEQMERLRLATLGEIQRQEEAIRASNPNYTTEDWDAIYEIASSEFYKGNLLDAQQRYESIINSRIERYFNTKAGLAAGGTTPPPGADTIVVDVPGTGNFDDARAGALRWAEEFDRTQ